MASKHTHKYYRMNMNHVNVWACGEDDCSHYMPKHLEQMMQGKRSICWNCGGEFKLGPLSLQMERPTCNDCRGLGSVLSDDNEHEDLVRLFKAQHGMKE